MEAAEPAGEGGADGAEPGRRAKLAFVIASALALLAFVLAQVVRSSEADAPSSQAKRLMPHIGAELVDQPLSQTQGAWPLENRDGKTLTLADLPRDRLVFLNFWATWCAPCRQELPSMFRLREALGDRRFMMVAVSYDEAWDDIRGFFEQWVGRLPSDGQMLLLKDTSLEDGHTLRETFGTTKIPDTYVLLAGRVVARFVNARDWTDPTIIEYFRKIAPGDGEGAL